MAVVNDYRVQKVTQNCFKVLDLKVSNCVVYEVFLHFLLYFGQNLNFMKEIFHCSPHLTHLTQHGLETKASGQLGHTY